MKLSNVLWAFELLVATQANYLFLKDIRSKAPTAGYILTKQNPMRRTPNMEQPKNKKYASKPVNKRTTGLGLNPHRSYSEQKVEDSNGNSQTQVVKYITNQYTRPNYKNKQRMLPKDFTSVNFRRVSWYKDLKAPNKHVDHQIPLSQRAVGHYGQSTTTRNYFPIDDLKKGYISKGYTQSNIRSKDGHTKATRIGISERPNFIPKKHRMSVIQRQFDNHDGNMDKDQIHHKDNKLADQISISDVEPNKNCMGNCKENNDPYLYYVSKEDEKHKVKTVINIINDELRNQAKRDLGIPTEYENSNPSYVRYVRPAHKVKTVKPLGAIRNALQVY